MLSTLNKNTSLLKLSFFLLLTKYLNIHIELFLIFRDTKTFLSYVLLTIDITDDDKLCAKMHQSNELPD